MANIRHQLDQLDLAKALALTVEELRRRTKEKGMGVMVSSHEIQGILDEEFDEFKDEVRNNGSAERKIEELLDIAVGAIFGIASIQSGGVDW
jgi:hypothetical protein